MENNKNQPFVFKQGAETPLISPAKMPERPILYSEPPKTPAMGEVWDEQKVMTLMMGMLNKLQLLQWCTLSYAKHHAMKDLHAELSVLVDRFVRTYLGRFRKQPVRAFQVHMDLTTYASDDHVLKYLENVRYELGMLPVHMNLGNAFTLTRILDEMVSAIDRAFFHLNLM